MNLSETLAFTTAQHFIQVHPCFTSVMKKVEIINTTREFPKETQQFTSWIPHGSHWLTIMKHENKTIVYCHENDMMYYASPNVILPDTIPNGHAFLAQTCVDNDIYPRLLILDLVLPHHKKPADRGVILRSLTHFFPSTCTVQWIGEVSALKKFLKGGLPHQVECVIGLQEPLKLLRESLF